MDEQELLIAIENAKTQAKDAEQLYKISAYDDAERCCYRILHLLEPIINDSAAAVMPESLEYKVINEVAYAYNRLNTISIARGTYDIAEQQANRALELSTRINDKRRIGILLGNQGLIYNYRGEYERALECYHQALAVHESIDNKLSIARVLNNIGSVYFVLAQLDLALSYYLKAMDLFDELGGQLESAGVLFGIGALYQKRGELLPALELFEKALHVSIEYGNQSFEARSHSSIGEHYHFMADYASAIKHYEQSTQLYEKLGEKPGLITDLHRIALVYRDTGNIKKAIEYLEQAEKDSEFVGLIPLLISTRSQLARAYIQLPDFQRAQQYAHRCLDMLDRASNPLTHSHCLETLGIIAHRLGKVVECERYYLQALEFRQPDKDSSEELCSLLLNLGVLHREKGEYDKAKTYFFRAIETAEKMGERASLRDAYRELSTLLAETNDFEKAYEFHKQFHHLTVLLHSQEANDRIAHFEYTRKNAEREKQLEIERTHAIAEKRILSNILPEEITTRLIQGENPIADTFESVSVLFMDIVDFTTLSIKMSAQQLVHLLNVIFSAADGVMRECGLEKIKTIGDAYMAVAGAPIKQEDHAQRAAQAALKLLDVMQNLAITFPENYGDRSWIESIPEIYVRIGLHCGPVAAGVVGENKFLYDLWGDAVNTASRMESHGTAGKIHVSEEFIHQLSMDNSQLTVLETTEPNVLPIANSLLTITPRGEIEIKGKGTMRTYFLERA